jgi:HPt (histidine-containing phosphotransfer) domain-containing protein
MDQLAALTPVIDVSALQQHRGRMTPDGPLTHRLIEMFSQTSCGDLAELRTALEQDDPRSFLRASHTLKSNAAMLGLRRLQSVCADAEDLARRAQDVPEPRLGASERVEPMIDTISVELQLGLTALLGERERGRFAELG